MVGCAVSLLILVAFAGSPFARTPVRNEPATSIAPPPGRASDTDLPGPLFTTAAATTTVIYSETFDSPGGCAAAGWTEVDLTAEDGIFFHVDDYAGLGAGFSPLQGTKSLWCGARPATSAPLCHYATLPGYGNSWDQYFGTKNCIPVTGNLDVSFLMHTDSEPSYDATFLEYTADCTGQTGWRVLDGGKSIWDGDNNFVVSKTYAVGGATDVRVRLRFRSDGAWSDQDGLFFTDGAVHIDNLAVEGLPLEDFEDDAVDATSTSDWEASARPGYGSFAGLVHGSDVLQEDPCASNLTCMWGFFEGSTYDYSCGGHPEQTAVPYGKGFEREQYLFNVIWSPDIPLTGSGSVLILEFSVYRDLTLDSVMHYVWHIRSGSGSCPGPWRDKGFLYFGDQKDWYVHREDVSLLVDLSTATYAKISLGALDLCYAHCFIFGSGDCHSHSPLIDNVRLLRVDLPAGPQWSIFVRNQFQDNFPADGTITGTVRADAAQDMNNLLNPVLPWDVARVRVADPFNGLATDPVTGGDAVYIYASVWPQGPRSPESAAPDLPIGRSSGTPGTCLCRWATERSAAIRTRPTTTVS